MVRARRRATFRRSDSGCPSTNESVTHTHEYKVQFFPLVNKQIYLYCNGHPSPLIIAAPAVRFWSFVAVVLSSSSPFLISWLHQSTAARDHQFLLKNSYSFVLHDKLVVTLNYAPLNYAHSPACTSRIRGIFDVRPCLHWDIYVSLGSPLKVALPRLFPLLFPRPLPRSEESSDVESCVIHGHRCASRDSVPTFRDSAHDRTLYYISHITLCSLLSTICIGLDLPSSIACFINHTDFSPSYGRPPLTADP